MKFARLSCNVDAIAPAGMGLVLEPPSLCGGPAASLDDLDPRQNQTPIKQIKLFVREIFRPKDLSHWIRLEIQCYVVIFMCPEMRYGPGSDRIDFGTPLPQQSLKVCSKIAGKRHRLAQTSTELGI